ncbi:transcriptional regulator [Cupriavidus sp. SK-4]|uniref:TetR/AcrR family transcriptional regulator n=1 Tax=Cupriavidus sp. SK-4 TaxID=574750 RepID=UPI00044AAAD0|nr:TetR/AcrR family transcriptional regulator [Cupriavidus sp. SK-4]EYS87470.1 transcriptional regulator [Cupriavidus sp. SK-4]
MNLTMNKKPVESAEQPVVPLKAVVRQRKRLSKEARSEEVRKTIFAAAAEVVGERGYADASISRITDVAGIAQGTFYLYFESRQALFDELLPTIGQEMLEYLRQGVAGAKDVFDVEERAFRALFEYIDRRPGFSRILREAEFVAPAAYEKHYKRLCERYMDSLERGVQSGQIRHFSHNELETVANMLIAARAYLLYDARRKIRNGEPVELEEIIQTYMKLVRKGLR